MRKEIYLLPVAGFFLVSVLVMPPASLAAQARPEAAPFNLRAGGFGVEATTTWPTVIAQQKGFFAREGLAVSYTRSYEQMQALIGGSFDVIDDGADSPILVADKGGDIVVVYETSHRPAQFMVLGPNINSVKELEGKIVGVWKIPSPDQVILKTFLGKQGVDVNKVAFLRAGGSPDRLAALQSGRIGATVLSPEVTYSARRLGLKILATPRDWGVFPWNFIVFKKQWAEANPDVVVKYVRAIHRAIKWLPEQANFDEAVQLLSQAARTEPEAVRWILQSVLKDELYNVEKPSAPILQLHADWLLSEKFLTKPFNTATIIDTGYYERAIR